MIDNDKLQNFFNLLVVENRKTILPYFRKKIEVETKTDLSPVTIADKLGSISSIVNSLRNCLSEIIS